MIAPIEAHREIVSGDDYKIVDGRALTWFDSSWPGLQGSTLTLTAGYDNANIFGSIPVKWVSTMPATPETREAVLELTAVQTKELQEGCFDYVLRAVLADASTVTLATGKLTVQQEPGQAPLAP